MNEDTLETIREHLEENDAQYASMAEPQPHCDYPTDSGPCSREVDHPDDHCWQHEDNE